jgi:hypothetical protein
MLGTVVTTCMVGLILMLLDPLFWIGLGLAVAERADARTRDRRIWQVTELR